MLEAERIEAAAAALDPVFAHSPQYVTERLVGHAGVLLKLETCNPIGSFKGRGAGWWLKSRRPAAVVCASAGNFGQGLAHAARRSGTPVEVYAAETANRAKIDAMRALGARVTLSGRDFDEAKARAESAAIESGRPYVEDGRDDEIAEGAGTIAVELVDSGARIDVIYVPVGNGALVNGVGSYLRRRSPRTRVVGVCVEGAPSMERSWRRGEPVDTESVDTIADGVAARVPIPRALEHMAEVVDDMLLVSDEQVVDAMRALFEREQVVAEPSGAVSLAAAVADPGRRPEELAAVIVTGSNVDPERRDEWLLTSSASP